MQVTPANGSPDEWVWKAREYIAPLVNISIVGELIVSENIHPLHVLNVLPTYVEMYPGENLTALPVRTRAWIKTDSRKGYLGIGCCIAH